MTLLNPLHDSYAQRFYALLRASESAQFCEFVSVPNGISPSQAGALIAKVSSHPFLRIADSDLDSIPALWGDVAQRMRLVDPNGDVLISIGGLGMLPWARVRVLSMNDLPLTLCLYPGEPNLIAMATDGKLLLGITSEEYECWCFAARQTASGFELFDPPR